MDYKFKDIIINSLNKRVPLKRKYYLRANYLIFIMNELSKAIMKRSKLCNLYLEVRSNEKRSRYKKQRNICVSLLRKAKRRHYEDLTYAKKLRPKAVLRKSPKDVLWTFPYASLCNVKKYFLSTS